MIGLAVTIGMLTKCPLAWTRDCAHMYEYSISLRQRLLRSHVNTETSGPKRRKKERKAATAIITDDTELSPGKSGIFRHLEIVDMGANLCTCTCTPEVATENATLFRLEGSSRMSKWLGFRQHEAPSSSLVLLSAPWSVQESNNHRHWKSPLVFGVRCARSRNYGRLHLWLFLRVTCICVQYL
ncbi:hypothetical protein GGI35DRAFT_34141 [Trichoderma velutinum]